MSLFVGTSSGDSYSSTEGNTGADLAKRKKLEDEGILPPSSASQKSIYTISPNVDFAKKAEMEQYDKILTGYMKSLQAAPGRRQTLLTTRSQDLKNLTLNNLATLPEYKWM
jgi:hypothetical protein